MKAIKRITALALCALMLLGLLSGCGEKKQGDEKFVLNASVCNVIDSLDPAMNTDTDADSVFYALYENLMRESDDGSGEVTLTNGMAKEYAEETNYDGSVTYRFTLRSTARWSDGEKVTADDFVYAWQRLADPATDSPNHALMSVVAGYDDVRETGDKTKLQVSAKDESTFVVTLSAPCAYFIEGICTAVATMPLRRDLAEAKEELSYAGYYSTSMFPPVELLYVTGTENDAVASALQSMWSTTLGVNVMLRGVTQSEYNARMEAGNYELALQKVTALYDDAMGFLDRWCSEDEQNLISYENGTYDVLMGVARASENPVARTAFLHDAETMLLGETALSPVYFDGTAHMLRDTLRGVYTDGFGNSYFAGVRANTD